MKSLELKILNKDKNAYDSFQVPLPEEYWDIPDSIVERTPEQEAKYSQFIRKFSEEHPTTESLSDFKVDTIRK